MVFLWRTTVLYCTDTQDVLVESCYATPAHPYGYTRLDSSIAGSMWCGDWRGTAYINLYITLYFPSYCSFFNTNKQITSHLIIFPLTLTRQETRKYFSSLKYFHTIDYQSLLQSVVPCHQPPPTTAPLRHPGHLYICTVRQTGSVQQ